MSSESLKFNNNVLILKKIYRIYWTPLWVLVITFLFGIEVCIEYSNYLQSTIDINSRNVAELICSGLITFSATGMGVFIPLSLQRNLRKEDQRRALLFALTAVWSELRLNKTILNNFKKNFQFAETLNPNDKQYTIEEKIKLTAMKFNSLTTICKSLKRTAYESMLNSGAISYMRSDNLYNIINNVYDDLEDFYVAYSIHDAGLNLRNKSTELLLEKGVKFTGTPFEPMVYEEINQSITKINISLNYSLSLIKKAINDVHKVITDYGVKIEEVEKKII